jgi:hypothetical protein
LDIHGDFSYCPAPVGRAPGPAAFGEVAMTVRLVSFK